VIAVIKEFVKKNGDCLDNGGTILQGMVMTVTALV
jgi:hypothetical protein